MCASSRSGLPEGTSRWVTVTACLSARFSAFEHFLVGRYVTDESSVIEKSCLISFDALVVDVKNPEK